LEKKKKKEANPPPLPAQVKKSGLKTNQEGRIQIIKKKRTRACGQTDPENHCRHSKGGPQKTKKRVRAPARNGRKRNKAKGKKTK